MTSIPVTLSSAATLCEIAETYGATIAKLAKKKGWRPLEVALAARVAEGLAHKAAAVTINNSTLSLTDHEAMLIVDTIPALVADVEKRSTRQKWRPSERAMTLGALTGLRNQITTAFPMAAGVIPGTVADA